MLNGVNHLLFGPQSHNAMREGLESTVIAISLGQKEEKKGDCELVLTTGDGGNKYRWDLGVDLNSEKPQEATEIVYSSGFFIISLEFCSITHSLDLSHKSMFKRKKNKNKKIMSAILCSVFWNISKKCAKSSQFM